MNGAYVCSDRGIPVFGTKGCSLHVQEITRAFEQRGIHINLFAASLGKHCPNDLTHINTHRIKHRKITDRAVREQSDVKDNQIVLADLEQSGPFDFVYERYTLWSHAGMTYAKNHGIPAILEVNAPLIEEQTKYRGLIDVSGAKRVTQQCFKAASVILAVSKEVAQHVNLYDEAKGKVHVLPNGVNVERFSQVHTEQSLKHKVFTVGFVGTLKPWHGVERLIKGFALLHDDYPNTRLLIVGDGPQKQEIANLVLGLGLSEAVELTGAVNPNQIPDYYEEMDVGVAPYPNMDDFYFSPLKVYEYMAAGLPVVASDIGQISELIEDHISGLLYSPEELPQLTQAFEYLINHPEESKKLGASGREIAVLQHSWQNRLERILSLAGVA